MQTKFLILAGVFGVITGLSFSTNQNILLSIGTALIAAALGLAALLSKDKKDKQIEEMHAITTKNSKSDHMNDLRNITEEFLNQQHVFIFSQFDSDITKLIQKCRLQNHFNDTYAMNQLIALVASYSNDFLAQIENRTTKINGSKSFLDQKIKEHLEKYLESDVEFLNQKLAAIFPMRIKSTPMTNAMREGEVDLRKIYTGFLLKMFDL